MGFVPLQLPSVELSRFPCFGVPEISGSVVFLGAVVIAAPDAPASIATTMAPVATSVTDPRRLVSPPRYLPSCLALLLILCSFPCYCLD
jgi:hypothetical protein